jgi:nucleotide-binding universal stress UspA family protein
MNPTFRNILVPVDFSPPSNLALKYALELSRTFGATLHVIHAWEVPAYLRPDLTVWAGEVSTTLSDQVRLGAENAMRELSRDYGLDGNDAITCELIPGAPYNTILEVAKDGEFDLVVMGTHGRTGLSHALLGSVAEKVVRHAACPVLTVRVPGDDAPSKERMAS